MTPPAQNEVTQLLLAWSDGDKAALEELTPLVYAELRRLAERYMRRERAGHPGSEVAQAGRAPARRAPCAKAEAAPADGDEHRG